MNIQYENFNWELYIVINKDLNEMKTKELAWDHWINHGIHEERPLSTINNSNIHNGRLGNLFFVNMVLHFLSLKLNLNSNYKYFDKFVKLGIYLHKGNNSYDDTLTITDDNFIEIIQNSDISKCNVILNNENWFQTSEFASYLQKYFNISYNKYKITEKNIFKNRYNCNNDLFIHVRLGDVESRVNNIIQYYDETIKNLIYNNGYISSDDISNPMCQFLIKKYNLIIINYDVIETIMFASTCNNIILSGGTFSWLIGFFSFYSKNIYYPNLKNCWFGDIFKFSFWKSIDFN